MSSKGGAGEDPDDWDKILEAAMTGEIEMDDERVRGLPPKQREELERLVHLRGALGRQFELDRQMEAEVRRTTRDELPSEVERFLRERLETPVRPWTRPRTIVAMIAIAAGLLAVLWLGFGRRHDSPPPRPDGPTLGTDNGVVPLSPEGVVGEYNPFRWSATTLEAGWAYRVRVFAYDEKTKSKGKEIEFSPPPELKQTEWRTDVDLPDHIVWRVDLVPVDREGTSQPKAGREIEASKE
jgi:hypothetical protein